MYMQWNKDFLHESDSRDRDTVQLVSMVTSTHEHMLQVNFVTHEYFFLNIHDVNYYPLANMRKFFYAYTRE